jgi:hypothetical protein
MLAQFLLNSARSPSSPCCGCAVKESLEATEAGEKSSFALRGKEKKVAHFRGLPAAKQLKESVAAIVGDGRHSQPE